MKRIHLQFLREALVAVSLLTVLAVPAPTLAGVAELVGVVQIELDPFDQAAEEGRAIWELRILPVAILGSQSFDPSTVAKKGLRFGPRLGTTVPVHVHKFPKVLRDVNGDGFEDRVAFFDTTALGDDYHAGRESHVFVQGVVERKSRAHGWWKSRAHGWWKSRAHGWQKSRADGGVIVQTFVTFANLHKTTEGFSQTTARLLEATAALPAGCSIVLDATVARCTYHEFYSNGIDLNQLINGINANLDTGYKGSITEESFVAIEAHGANGQEGRTSGSNVNGGKGGSGGYAVNVQTVSTLMDLAEDFSGALWVYPGNDGVENMSGGASSIAMLQEVTKVTDVTNQNPSAAGVLVIAGGGGGGGRASEGTYIPLAGTVGSHMGLDGGDGGELTIVHDSDWYAQGSSGKSSSNVTGGGGGHGGKGVNTKFPENDGTAGAGGQGGLAYDRLTGWKNAPDCTCEYGKGGPSVNGGGAGGGGYGGGASGQGTTSKSGGAGGGGGASFAMATDATLTAPDGLLEGHSAATNSIVISFEILLP